MAWDIEPEGCQIVLEATAEQAGRFEEWGEGYAAHLQSAAASAGTLHLGGGERPEGGLVAVALSQFAEHHQQDLMAIVARAGNSLNGAVQAIVAYAGGDLDMAARAQQAALDVSGEIDRGILPGLEPEPYDPHGPV